MWQKRADKIMGSHIKIGKNRLLIPDGHNLAEIMRKHPNYDFGPWDTIARIVKDNPSLSGATLIDVGANIGDSAAHYRRFSDGFIVSVEPNVHFFDFLKRNTENMGDVNILNGLVVPKNLIGRVSYAHGSQTGTTKISENPKDDYEGEIYEVATLLDLFNGPIIFKSDTDGFDAELVGRVAQLIDENQYSVDLILFEGPTEADTKSGEFLDYTHVCRKLQDMGYSILLFSNFGDPVSYVATSFESLRWHFTHQSKNLQDGIAKFHYFDILAISSKIEIDSLFQS